MSRSTRKSLLALAAIASLGAFALATDDASARGFGGGGMRAHGGGHGGMRIHGGGLRHIGGFRHVGLHRPGHIRVFPRRPIVIVRPHRPHWHWRWRYGWRRPYWIAPVVATGVATAAVAAPSWNRCSCLTKEYTPQGAVLFKDLCTRESAMYPPLVQQSAYDPAQDLAAQASLQQQAQPVVPQLQPQGVPLQGAVPQAQ